MSFEELIQAFGGKERPYVLIPIDIRSCTMRSVEITKKCSGKHDRKEVKEPMKSNSPMKGGEFGFQRANPKETGEN